MPAGNDGSANGASSAARSGSARSIAVVPGATVGTGLPACAPSTPSGTGRDNTAVPLLPGGFDLTDLDNFADGFPHDVFVWHRREAPVLWCEPTEHTPDGEGFWSVSTHAETLAVLHDPDTYSSERGGDRPYGGTILPDSPTAGMLLNMMDDPRHQRIRALVTPGLTPKRLASIEPELPRRTRMLLDAALERDDGRFDYLVDVAG